MQNRNRFLICALFTACMIIMHGEARAESFGSTTTVTEVSWGYSVHVMPFTSPGTTGTLDSIVIRGRDNGTDDTIQGVVYTSTGSAPQDLVDTTGNILVTENVQTVVKANFIQHGTINASTQYYIGLINTRSGNLVQNSARTSGGVGVTYKNYQTAIPNPFGTPTGTDAGYEFYATVYYTASGGSGASIAVGTANIGTVKLGP